MIFKVTNPLDPNNPWKVEADNEEDAIEQMAEEWAGEEGPDYAFAKSLTYERSNMMKGAEIDKKLCQEKMASLDHTNPGPEFESVGFVDEFESDVLTDAGPIEVFVYAPSGGDSFYNVVLEVDALTQEHRVRIAEL